MSEQATGSQHAMSYLHLSNLSDAFLTATCAMRNGSFHVLVLAGLDLQNETLTASQLATGAAQSPRLDPLYQQLRPRTCQLQGLSGRKRTRQELGEDETLV
ncbi:hypothetical protein Vafri_2110 [Volvox africanus]|nr:hypothetical protein Vafri_2110 [Volvox africanus]